MADETLHITEDERTRMPTLGGVLIRVKLHVRGRGGGGGGGGGGGALSEKQEIQRRK